MKIIFENNDLLVINKLAGVNADDIPMRVHRLDKDTSGILLIAKNNETLEFLQKQFQERKVGKKYIALVVGSLKNTQGEIDEAFASSSPFANARVIETLLGRSQRDGKKQKVYLPGEPGAEGKRKAITKYRVLQKFKKYTLIEVKLETGRKHQIRAHFAFLLYPIAGDKMYGFKNQPVPHDLERQFLHANQLEIKMPDGKIREFKSKLPNDLKKVLNNLSR